MNFSRYRRAASRLRDASGLRHGYRQRDNGIPVPSCAAGDCLPCIGSPRTTACAACATAGNPARITFPRRPKNPCGFQRRNVRLSTQRASLWCFLKKTAKESAITAVRENLKTRLRCASATGVRGNKPVSPDQPVAQKLASVPGLAREHVLVHSAHLNRESGS